MRRRLAAFAVALTATLAFAASAQAGDYIVVLKDSVNADAVEAKHKAKGAKVTKEYRHALNGYAASMSTSTLAAVKADPSVRFVAEDRKLKLPRPEHPKCCRAHSQDPQEVGTAINRIDAEASSARSGDGRGAVDVNVAVIDTGVDPNQSELRVAGGFNCVGDDPRAWQDVDPDFGHGTAVAGLIASQDNPVGEVGVAPGARIWSIRGIDETGFGTDSSFLCAADYVTATRTDGTPNNDIAVANLSGADDPGESDFKDDQNCGLTNGDPMHLAVCRATAAGVVWVDFGGTRHRTSPAASSPLTTRSSPSVPWVTTTVDRARTSIRSAVTRPAKWSSTTPSSVRLTDSPSSAISQPSRWTVTTRCPRRASA